MRVPLLTGGVQCALYHICTKLGDVFNTKPVSLTAHVIRGGARHSWKCQSPFAFCHLCFHIPSQLFYVTCGHFVCEGVYLV